MKMLRPLNIRRVSGGHPGRWLARSLLLALAGLTGFIFGHASNPPFSQPAFAAAIGQPEGQGHQMPGEFLRAAKVLLPGKFYYYEAHGLSISLEVRRSGAVSFTGTLGRNPTRSFVVRYHPGGHFNDGSFGVPVVTMMTSAVTRAANGKFTGRATIWSDVGIRGRPLFQGGSGIRRGGPGPFWWLDGKWVRGAKVHPPFLQYLGKHYRYNAKTGEWKSVGNQRVR